MSRETKEIKSPYSIFPPPTPLATTYSLNASSLFIALSGITLRSISSKKNSSTNWQEANKVLEQLQQAIPIFAALEEKGCLQIIMDSADFIRVLHENIEHLKSAEAARAFRELLNPVIDHIALDPLINNRNMERYTAALSLIRNAAYLIEFNRFMNHIVIGNLPVGKQRKNQLFLECVRNFDFLKLHHAKFKNTLMTLKNFGLLQEINIINVLEKLKYLEKLDHALIWAEKNQILNQVSQTYNQLIFNSFTTSDYLFTLPFEEWDKVIVVLKTYGLFHPQNLAYLFRLESTKLPFVTFALKWMADRHFPFSNDIFQGVCCFANDETDETDENQEQSTKQIIENFGQVAPLLEAADLFDPDNFSRLLQIGNFTLVKVFLRELVENKGWDRQQKKAIFTAFTQCSYDDIYSEMREDIALAFAEIIKGLRQINLYSSENIATLFVRVSHIVHITAVSTWLNWAITENFFDGQPGDQELLETIIKNGSGLSTRSEVVTENFKAIIMRLKARGLLEGNNKNTILIAVINSINPDGPEEETLEEPISILLSDARYQKRQLSLAREYGLEVTDPALAIKMVNATQADFACIMQYGTKYPLHIAEVLERLEELEPSIYSFHPNSAFGKALAINPANADAILELWFKLCQPPFTLMSIEQVRAGITNPQPDLTPDPESVPCIWQKTLKKGYDYSALYHLITTAIKVGFGDKEGRNEKVKFENLSQKEKAELLIFFVAISSTELTKALSSVLGEKPTLEDFKSVLGLARYKNLLKATQYIATRPSDIKINNLPHLFGQGESKLAEGRLPDATASMIKEGFYAYIVQALSRHSQLSTVDVADSKDIIQAILADLKTDPEAVTQLPPTKMPLQLKRSPFSRIDHNDISWPFQDMLRLFRTAKKKPLNEHLASRLGKNIVRYSIAPFLMEEPTLSFTWKFLEKRWRNDASGIVGDGKRTAPLSSSTQEPATENPEAASDSINSSALKRLGVGPR